MPRDTDVFCIQCQQYMPRSRERAHRALHRAPLLSPPRLPSKLRRVFNIDPEQACAEISLQGGEEVTALATDTGTDVVEALEISICDRWNHNLNIGKSDTEDEGDDLGANEEDDYLDAHAFDWDRFEASPGLSAWDQLGEGYEQDAAMIAERLSQYDLAICRAFSYKVKSHTTDEDFRKLPYAFPTDPPLPGLDKIRSRMTFLSGFQPQQYDCCPNACCCYTGPHVNLSKCPYCGEARNHPDGRPRKKFTYIPITPRLVSFVGNHCMAGKMQYRARIHKHSPDATSDVFDGSHYRSLRGQRVQLNGQELSHKYFEDHRDIALGLSADGFPPFKKRKATAWAFIILNYNLPPDIRFHVGNILALGVIGPKKPIDIDSFLWPAVQELLRLLVGVRAFDILTSTVFCLRAFLILVFGDIPAMALLMHMKGHNGISPCRMCKITGLRVPNSRATTHYVPLNRSRHCDVQANITAVKAFDPQNLPMRTHDELRSQANEVQSSLTNADADFLAKTYGIKGTSIFFYLHSISFPTSFPYDFMHLIWENLIPNLVLLWTGKYKGLDQGTESYELPKTVWEAIGEATAASGSSIPSAYGSRVPNVAKDNTYYSAEMWSFWTLYLGPIFLRRRFQRPKYYNHFIRLVHLLNLCLQFEITLEHIEEIRQGLIQWVKDYEDIYYQHNPDRLSACPLTIHAILHIADSIEALGPVWAYWAFPMERFCGILQRAIRSRRFPYASLDRFITETTQLNQIANVYDITDVISLQSPRSVAGGFSHHLYPSCVLLPPRSRTRPAENFLTSIAAALVTRFDVNIHIVRKHLKDADIEEWGKIRRIDSDAGDTMHASSLVSTRDDTRDATYVRYEMLVDKHARHARRRPEYQLQTFYGQLQHIFVVNFRTACAELGLSGASTIFLAAIRTCTLDDPDPQLRQLDIHLSSSEGAVHIIDVTSLQCLVGRIRDRDKWAIIDRSGSLARALYVEDGDD